MFKFLFGTSLKSKVMKAINQKIKDAQVAFDNDMAELKKNYHSEALAIIAEAKSKLKSHDENFCNNKEHCTNRHVTNLLNKVI